MQYTIKGGENYVVSVTRGGWRSTVTVRSNEGRIDVLDRTIVQLPEKEVHQVKYYRVVKDHPIWDVGAILSNKQEKHRYSPISDIWDKRDTYENFYESDSLVEDSDWFQRVYEISLLGKVKYVTKAAAKKVYDDVYKEK